MGGSAHFYTYPHHPNKACIRAMQKAKSMSELLVLAREMYLLPVGKEREQMYMVYAAAIEKRWGRFQTSRYEQNKQNVARRVALKRLEVERASRLGEGPQQDQQR